MARRTAAEPRPAIGETLRIRRVEVLNKGLREMARLLGIAPTLTARIFASRRGRRQIDQRASSCLERRRRKLRLDAMPLPAPVEEWVEGPLGIRFGCTHLPHPGEGVLGATFVKDREILIDEQVLSHEGRCRFSSAHELGHLVLHAELQSVFHEAEDVGPGSPTTLEREADRFAAAFLMPLPRPVGASILRALEFRLSGLRRCGNRREVSERDDWGVAESVGGAHPTLWNSDKATMAGKTLRQPADTTDEVWSLIPAACRDLADPQRDLPRIARDQNLMAQIESAVRSAPTRHDLHLGDARRFDFLMPKSVHLVVTSPPYWTLKKYRETPGQLGHVGDYDALLSITRVPDTLSFPEIAPHMDHEARLGC